MDEQKITELEKAQLKNEIVVNQLAEKMKELADITHESSRALLELRGVTRLLTWGLLPLLTVFLMMGGYMKTQFDKELANLWQHSDTNETQISRLTERITKLEYVKHENH